LLEECSFILPKYQDWLYQNAEDALFCGLRSHQFSILPSKMRAIINMSQHHWNIANTTEWINWNYWDLMQILFCNPFSISQLYANWCSLQFQIIGLRFGCRLIPVAIVSKTNKRWSGAGSYLLWHLFPSPSVLFLALQTGA